MKYIPGGVSRPVVVIAAVGRRHRNLRPLLVKNV